jgi:hypothetical protein
MEVENKRSKRKPHNRDAGYIAERRFGDRSHIVIYNALEAGIDVAPDKYAIVCSKHGTMCGASSVPKARALMKYPEFCETCVAEDIATIENPIFREAVRIARKENKQIE